MYIGFVNYKFLIYNLKYKYVKLNMLLNIYFMI